MDLTGVKKKPGCFVPSPLPNYLSGFRGVPVGLTEVRSVPGAESRKQIPFMEEIMNKKHPVALALAAALTWTIPVHAADSQKAKDKTKTCLIAGWENPASVCASHNKVITATCFICHGPNGKSASAIPSLAGQDKAYLVTAMKEFRDGKRETTVMQKYAIGYTDEEYEAMAEFFSKVK